ncbi:MAG: hypothetical protein A2583_14280 [Bdellovibrionales bacterium RIFOXYD1_FULL_53_11]|nr:MAG: hypothetical protein A2583_14280 [Bdellovibrionales bacterium RIFOXYD1_FULL_53_11]
MIKSASIDKTADWYDGSYEKDGLGAQRSYPNEELVRFIARNYSGVPADERKNIKILEAGCGPGGNLWMLGREGFSVSGLDISPKALELARKTLGKWQTDAELKAGSMTEMPFEDGCFEAIVDVLASFSLLKAEFDLYLNEVTRCLRPGGRFFIFTLSTGSDAFKNYSPATLIEPCTLDGIYRKDSPYYGCFYPHRFSEVGELEAVLSHHGLVARSSELISRTYNRRSEMFQYIAADAQKIS